MTRFHNKMSYLSRQVLRQGYLVQPVLSPARLKPVLPHDLIACHGPVAPFSDRQT